MPRARTFLAICALALPISLVATGCGGDEAADRDPREVVEQTFDNDTTVTSGVVDLSLNGAATGQESGTFSAELAGSFQGEEGEERKLPQVDLTGSITGTGDGEDVDESARVIITDANAFLEYDGETYEAGEEMYAEFQDEVETQVEETGVEGDMAFRQACEEAIRQLGGDVSACDIDVSRDWLTNLENEGTEDVEGAETVHVSGDLNVERMLSDIGEMGGSIEGFNLEGVDPSQFAPAIPEASFDLYSGVDDDLLRRLDVRLVIDPSAVTGGFAVVPVDRVEIDFALTLSELNEAQTIEDPAGPTTPLEDLTGGLGLDAFGGGLRGLPRGGPDDSAPAPDDGSGAGSPGAGEIDPEDISPEQAQEYLDCIQEATQAGDPDAINACADQL